VGNAITPSYFGIYPSFLPLMSLAPLLIYPLRRQLNLILLIITIIFR